MKGGGGQRAGAMELLPSNKLAAEIFNKLPFASSLLARAVINTHTHTFIRRNLTAAGSLACCNLRL